MKIQSSNYITAFQNSSCCENFISQVTEAIKKLIRKLFCCGKAENVEAKSMLQTIERRHVEMEAELDAYNQVIALHERNGETGEYVDNLRRRVNDLQERANRVAAQGREIARENGWTFLGR